MNKPKIKLNTGLIIAVLAILTSFRPYAMDFKHLTLENGLSHSVVFAISQDRKGLMWFGTRSGIDSYDGTQFVHYDLTRDQNSLPSPAKHLLYDSNKVLWVATSHGLFRHNEEKGIFQPASVRYKSFENLNINKLSADLKNRIWIGTSNTLYLYIPEKDSVIHFREIRSSVNDLQVLEDGSCLAATAKGIYKINSKDFGIGSLSVKSEINEKFSNEFISSIYEDQFSRIWIAVLNKGLYIYDKGIEKLTQIREVDKYISGGVQIKDIEQVNDSDYLVATDGNGLLYLKGDFSVRDHFYHIEDDQSSLSNNGIYEIFKDTENRVWIATYGGGINLYDQYLLPFTRIEHITNNQNSVANNTGRAVLEDDNKRLWFATKKGISIYHPAENSWRHIFNTADKPYTIGQNTVLSICQVSPEEIWIGSYGGGIDRIDTKTFRTTPLLPKEEFAKVFGSPYVYSIQKSRDGMVWIGLLRSRLVRYNPTSKEIVRYPIISVHHIQQSKSGEMLLGSKEGMYILSTITGEFKLYAHQDEDRSSINSNLVYSTLVDESGKILVGTEMGGLNIFDPGTGKFKHYGQRDGLPSNSVYGIIKDSKGMFWLSTTNGLSLFDPLKESFTNFDTSDGLHIKEFNYGSSCLTNSGKIIFGGNKGFVSFDPSVIRKISISPKLIFTDLKIANRSVLIDQPDGPLQKHLDLTDHLLFNYNQNSFSISFIGLNYTNPVKNQYTWILEGFEREWAPRISSNTATYTNIPPGHYNFRVRSTSDMHEWNGDERSIKIYVQPPFYRTFWAYLVYTMIVVSVALMILQFIRIRYEEHHAQEKIQFFINVAHDLRTPLTLIQSPLSRITESETLNESDKVNLYLAQKNAGKLSQLFNQLLEFQKADLNKLQVQIGAYDIVGHLKEVIAAFKPLLDKKKISCELKVTDDKLEVWYDELKLDKVFYNLISNAIKYNKENGKIVITVKSDKSNCYIEVIDNGIGIPADQQKKVFRSYFRASNAINSTETGSGVGLMLVRHLVELHHGKIDFVSKSGEGTCFKIKIPVKWKNFRSMDYLSDAEIASKKDTNPPVEMMHKSAQENPPLSDAAAEGKSKLPKILVVEDSEDLRVFLVNSLDPKYRIFAACNGKEALAVIEKNHPDLVLSDVMMPEMDGNMLCSHLKQHLETCHIPVILLTALTDNEYKIEGYEVGADAYLEKPFDINVLISRIDNLLRSRTMLRDKFLNYQTPAGAMGFNSKIDQEFIQKAIKIVEDNITDAEFSVEELCKKIFISRPVLYRKLKALTDQSPQDFIRIIRLKKAIELMLHTDNNINEVAYLTGFSDPKYFSTCFKKHYGKSPSSYLQENKSKIKVDI